MKMILAIAAGGAIGAVARHLFADQVTNLTGGGFPWGIFAVNVLGSFLTGLLVHMFLHLTDPMPVLRAFLAVGVLGAFTTFSTYSMDVVMLIERGALGQAAAYAIGSAVLAIGGLMGGMALGRLVFS